MNKDLTYYMSLTYPVTIVEIPESEGGGYSVSIPMLGRAAYVGDGASIEEALASLRKVQRFLFERVLKQGKPIPEPDDAFDQALFGAVNRLFRLKQKTHFFKR